ncbi:MAG: plastocyanin/azurin family copper-binding protein [Metallibacterium scheffleri]|uniref:plastocyanin/azurin family copper-binding protein n=1 Tax=Metallibacterium scheffleri TaxID=993689 RepID=UPI0026EAC1B1|nr:plastocyanin/azurin family copper-binding protein [Metallibacterium scheffleri]MCK9367202.1 plastocyanin/azurin family copper-binding protein [Metallibacterium scheffleri]
MRIVTAITALGVMAGLASGLVFAVGTGGPGSMQMGTMPKHLPKPGKPIAYETARPLIKYSNSAGTRMGRKTIKFLGHDIRIVMVAVEPGSPDQTFEIHRLVDPEVEVSAGARITLTLLNMDYGASMIHGVVVGHAKPPYKAIVPLPVADQIAEIPLTMPRTLQSVRQSEYFVDTTTFNAPQKPGYYYYFCQMPGHAKTGMYGKFVVAP